MPQADRPNILFLMDDQHRYDFLGAAGAGFVRTPNLDRIAASGVRFTHCVTNCPVCAPARIGLATGLQPARLGSLDNRSYLPLSAPTYYQRLRDHGYRVGCVGKLDLAKPDQYNGLRGDRPCAFGWGFTHPEEWEGKMHACQNDEPVGPYTHRLAQKGLLRAFQEDYRGRRAKGWVVGASHDSVLPTEDYEDACIGRRAAEWLADVPDDFPWHYFVSFVGPHDPFDPPAEYADKWRGADIPPALPAHLEGKPRRATLKQRNATPEDVLQARRQYAASIELIDDQIGRILGVLAARGMLANTYIVFASDHGEMLGDHGLFAKSQPYEPSVRVPLLAAGPGIQGGRVSDALVELMDVAPTLCELAGVPPGENLDARSLAPLLRGETGEHRPDCAIRIRGFDCLRDRRFKYVDNLGEPPELYDLEEDPGEQNNIAPENPDIRARMAQRIRERFEEGQWRR